jgi:hypothetical protein
VYQSRLLAADYLEGVFDIFFLSFLLTSAMQYNSSQITATDIAIGAVVSSITFHSYDCG